MVKWLSKENFSSSLERGETNGGAQTSASYSPFTSLSKSVLRYRKRSSIHTAEKDKEGWGVGCKGTIRRDLP